MAAWTQERKDKLAATQRARHAARTAEQRETTRARHAAGQSARWANMSDAARADIVDAISAGQEIARLIESDETTESRRIKQSSALQGRHHSQVTRDRIRRGVNRTIATRARVVNELRLIESEQN